ncbi:MAG: RecX family transcriptional regulator, partial [Nitrospinota bacterium]
MDEFEKAKLVAYRFLSYRPRSKKEIENKLIEKKISRNTITNILNFLEENNYINDKNFSINWIKYRLENKPMGRAFLEYELR